MHEAVSTEFWKEEAKWNLYIAIHIEDRICKHSGNIPFNYVPENSTKTILLVIEICIKIKNEKFWG